MELKCENARCGCNSNVADQVSIKSPSEKLLNKELLPLKEFFEFDQKWNGT